MKMKNLNNPIFCIMGPTASGKTSLAFDLAEKIPCEIINVDSAQIYCGMDVGTAKPSKEELKKVPHHLIDIKDPGKAYSAADFRLDALNAISDILSRNKIPLLVGGTMLYFKALQQGLSKLPSANPEIRKKILERASEIGWEGLHRELSKIDSKSAKRIHPNDAQRIQRALEVFKLTSRPMSELQAIDKLYNIPYKFINIALMPKDRSKLKENIERRFDKMIEDGFIEEVRVLFERGDLNLDLPSMRSVGYKQVWDYLAGKTYFDEMRKLAIIATCQLAKRQMTWLRNNKWGQVWKCDIDNKVETIELIFGSMSYFKT